MDSFMEDAEIPSTCGFCGAVELDNDFVPNPGNFVGIEAEHDFHCGTTVVVTENFLAGDVGVVFDNANKEFTVVLTNPEGAVYETRQKQVFYDTDGRTGTYEEIERTSSSQTLKMIYSVDGEERIDIVRNQQVVLQEGDTTITYFEWIFPVGCRDQDGVSVMSRVWTNYWKFEDVD